MKPDHDRCRAAAESRILGGILGLTILLGAGLAPIAATRNGAAAGQEDEEHGGDIVFHVESKLQKFSVLYSHEAHLDAGLDCDDCHEKLFKKEFEGNHFKMSDINRGKACGVCHQADPPEGVQGAFPPKKNCERCHTLRIRKPETGRR